MANSRLKKGTALLLSTALGCTALNCTEIHPYYLSVFLGDATSTQPTNPLVGIWKEREPISCDGKPLENHVNFGELVFHRGETFSFTLVPFENYVDCVGTYSFNPSTQDLSFTVTNGRLPADSDLIGTARPDPNNGNFYTLEGISFGTPEEVYLADRFEENILFERPCGYLIERTD